VPNRAKPKVGWGETHPTTRSHPKAIESDRILTQDLAAISLR